MNKITRVLPVALLLAASTAQAEWVKVGDTGDTAFHVDPASVIDKGDLRRVSVVQDYAKPDPDGVRSRLVLYEIDCTGLAIRSIAATEHAEPMAQGKRVSAWERESEWLYVAPRTGSNIAPRTPYAAIVRRTCAR